MESIDALGDPGLRAVLLFVRGRAGPVTADEVAEGLRLSRSVARWRLERLTEAALLFPTFERRSGITGPGAGRPAKLYAVAAETTTTEFPPRRYEELIGLLIDTLPRRGRRSRLSEVGASFGRRLALASKLRPSDRRRVALDRMCRALRDLGFQTAVESISGEKAIVVTPMCPLRPLVMKNPGAREIDQGMWCELVARAVEGIADSTVACETTECLNPRSACRIVIRMDRLRAGA